MEEAAQAIKPGARSWSDLLRWAVGLINLDSLAMGALCAMGATFAVFSASMDGLSGFVLLAGFLALPGMARDLLVSGEQRGRRIGKALLAVFFVVVVLGVAAVAERLYFTNADTYPSWAATQLDGGWDDPRNRQLVLKACEGRGGVMVIQKDEGHMVMRCGFSWAPGNTFIANVSAQVGGR